MQTDRTTARKPGRAVCSDWRVTRRRVSLQSAHSHPPARGERVTDHGERAGERRLKMTDQQRQDMQEHEKAAVVESGGGESKQERTFTTDQVTEIVKRRLDQQERKHQQEMQELRETLGVNVERAQHLEHENALAKKHMEELEELRAYKADREHGDLMQRISREYGVPIDLLSGETEGEITENARAISELVKTKSPVVPETKAGGATPAPDGYGGKASILGIKDRRERLRAIANNRALFDDPDMASTYDAIGEFIDLE